MAITVTPSFNSPVPVGQPQVDSVVATGGTAPYTYAITAGELPPGMVLNHATGAITGVPNTDGTFTVTITATDSLSATGSVTFSIVVVGPAPPAGISSWLPKGIDPKCMAGGKRFLQKTFNAGRLPGWTDTNGSIFFPNALNDAVWTQTVWNLLDSIQGQRSIERYESLLISWNHTRGTDNTDFAVVVDPGNGLPIYFGSNNKGAGDCVEMCVPFNSSSNTIKIGFQITGFALLPADFGLLTLGVANWKIKPYAYYTWGGFL